MLKIYPWPVIYHTSNEVGFGDRWATVSLLLKNSERTKKIQLISKKNWHVDIAEIKSCLNSQGDFKWVSEPGNHYLSHAKLYMSPYCPTQATWAPNDSKTICYQLDGRYKWLDKNLTTHETDLLFNHLHWLGYKIVDLGSMRPMKEIIQIMTSSCAFIGVPSGVSHIACSVGIPAYIICKHWLTSFGTPCLDFHKTIVYANKKNITLFPTLDSLLSSLKPQKNQRPIRIV